MHGYGVRGYYGRLDEGGYGVGYGVSYEERRHDHPSITTSL